MAKATEETKTRKTTKKSAAAEAKTTTRKPRRKAAPAAETIPEGPVDKSAEAVDNSIKSVDNVEKNEKKDSGPVDNSGAPVDKSSEVVDNSEKSVDNSADKGEDTPDVPETARIPRYDVVIMSERAGYRPPKAAVMAMVQQLAFRGLASPVDEAVAETWAEIYFEPGPSAHEIFIEKEYTSEAPVYREVVMRFTEKPFCCDFSETPKRPVYWSIEILGSRFKNPLGSFRKLFLDALNLRVAVAVCDARPAQPHKVVPDDELPVEKKKRERGMGLAGTEVEEV